MSYWLGVILAIASGIANNLGSLVQKKAVDELPQDKRESKFFRTLVWNPLWFAGLVLQLVIGTIFFMVAQLYIGPALTPGLMATGLIVLAIGSVGLIGESLRMQEVIGILLVIGATTLFAVSGLVIDIPGFDFLDAGFIMRITLFTGSLLILILILSIVRRTSVRWAAIALALISGLCVSISNYWIAVLMGTVAHVFDGSFLVPELILFTIASATLVLTYMFGLGTLQTAYKSGQANRLIPIQQFPIQVTPGIVYLVVFLLTPPSIESILFFFLGVFMIVISSFLLANRQMAIESMNRAVERV